MSWSSDEMLAERRLRSAELALETTRRRLVEANDEIGRLHNRIVELEQEVDVAYSAERERLRDQLDDERARRLEAEQTLQDELGRRAELEQELELSRAPWSATAERELADAQRRVRELEGELEVVRRHAAEFEQAIRLAVDEVWRWLGEIGDRLGNALVAQRALGAGDGEGAVEAGGAEPSGSLALERLDEARSRLRETPEVEFESASEPVRRGFFGRLLGR